MVCDGYLILEVEKCSKKEDCGVCSVVINVICVKGFDLFNIDAISSNPPSTPNLNKCFTKLIDDDDDGYWLLEANGRIFK